MLIGFVPYPNCAIDFCCYATKAGFVPCQFGAERGSVSSIYRLSANLAYCFMSCGNFACACRLFVSAEYGLANELEKYIGREQKV